jgi:hypothetical protein
MLLEECCHMWMRNLRSHNVGSAGSRPVNFVAQKAEDEKHTDRFSEVLVNAEDLVLAITAS